MLATEAYVMTPLEIAIGMPLGYEGDPIRVDGRRAAPRTVLEACVLEALDRPPCGVAFSGGRDSALVLAVATSVARREGLADPIPITKVFPDIPATDESEWQERIIRHLGLATWERVALHDELDLVGPIAQRHLREHGVVWPTLAHSNHPMYEILGGGSLLDGEGGDEVLDVAAHRVGALWACARARGRRGRRAALGSLAPRLVRSRLGSADGNGEESGSQMPWLSREVRRAMEREVRAEEIRRPLPYARSLRLMRTSRAWVLAERTRRVLAAEFGVEPISPLMSAAFIDAQGRERWLLGRGSRTEVLQRLAGDLLPEAVIRRTSKAAFNDAYWGPHTREFVRRWTGDGLSPALVDTEVLRRRWQAGESHALTFGLLQQAWLASDHHSP